MAESHPVGPFEQALFRAFQDAFYQHMIDESWDVVKAVFACPEIAEARRKILTALAEEFARRGVGGDGTQVKPQRPPDDSLKTSGAGSSRVVKV